jgi:hypothetical protein
VVASSWADRLARLCLPEEQIIEGLARTIYMTHWREPAPTWENARDGSLEVTRGRPRPSVSVA